MESHDANRYLTGGADSPDANPRHVQLASSSSLLDHLFTRGEFTQLEWIDFAARSLAVDGLVFDIRHFPRLDVEYLAEVRKLCVDRGLTIAALAVDDLFARDESGLDLVFGIAGELGTSITITNPPPPTDVPSVNWRENTARGKAIARLGKRWNITIGLRNAAETICTTAIDLKRFTKDIDSSWLRFAPEVSSLSAEELMSLQVRTVITTTRNFQAPCGDPARKGFLVLEQPQADTITIPEVAEAIRAFAAHLNRPAVSAV